MTNNAVLLRHLERETRARKEAENISEKKIFELYTVNCHLEELLIKQRKIRRDLNKRTLDLANEQRWKERLIKSNRELEQFAYIVSHDLKAPLRGIKHLASWIVEDCKDKLDDESKRHLELLSQRTRLMSDLIDGILQYSRAGRVDLEVSDVDTKALLAEVIDTLNPSKKFVITVAKNLPVFKTVGIILSQVFSNLISNSIKHHQSDAGIIELGVHDMGPYYKFFVADDGPGIDPKYFETIFDIFQTLQSKDESDSTGIGLTIVKKLVESQGGTVTLESAEGKGCTFYFTWPKVPEESIG